METKQLTASDLKVLDTGNGEIAGYASTYDWDSVRERVVPGAFSRHLDSFLKTGFVASGHDWSEPIGVPLEAFEDDKGLYVRAALHDTPRAQTVRTIIKDRLAHDKAVKLSIGYAVRDFENTKEGRLLKELELFEWSYVTVPANPNAVILAAKGAGGDRLTFSEHSEAMVTAAREFVERVKEHQDFRAKDGRVLSQANRQRIARLREELASTLTELDDLLAATEPKSNEHHHEEIQALLRRQATLFAQLRIET